MTKEYIEIKLHNGIIPYFCESVFGDCCVDGKFYGISRNTEQNYLPPTVLIKTEVEFKQILMDNSIIDVEDKEAYINEWISNNS